MTNTLKDKTAIVGVGATPYYRRGESMPQTSMELAGKAVIAALADAGLTVDDLDGFALYSMGFDTSLFAQWLGVPDVRFTGDAHRRRRWRGRFGRARGGRDRERHGRVRRVGDDAAAGGAAGSARRSRRSAAQPGATYSAPPSPEGNFIQPSGLMAPGQMFAVLAQRHMHLYGTTREHFCEVAISTRNNAIRRPTSLMQEPLTREQYFAARMISDPLCLYDFCLECDGAVAVVTTSAERARDLRHPPVYVMASANGGHGRWGQAITWMGMPDDEFASSGHRPVAQHLYDMAGVGPADVDVALLYDHFSPMVIMQLEDYGFCADRRGRSVRRRRQHPLARRRAAGEHARRQPVRGVHHRDDAREGSGRAAAGHRGEPGRRTRRSRSSPVAPRRFPVSSLLLRKSDPMTDWRANCGVPPADVIWLSPSPSTLAVLGSGRRAPARVAALHGLRDVSACRRRRSAGTAGAQDVEWIEHDGNGDDLFVHGDPARGDPAGDATRCRSIAAVVELPDTNGCRLIGERRRLRTRSGRDRAAGHARLVRRARGHVGARVPPGAVITSAAHARRRAADARARRDPTRSAFADGDVRADVARGRRARRIASRTRCARPAWARAIGCCGSGRTRSGSRSCCSRAARSARCSAPRTGASSPTSSRS